MTRLKLTRERWPFEVMWIVVITLVAAPKARVLGEQLELKNLDLGGSPTNNPCSDDSDCAGGVCVGGQCAGMNPQYVLLPPDDRLGLLFTIGGTYTPGGLGGWCSGGPCNAPRPRVRADVLDCNGDVIKSETFDVDVPTCEGQDAGTVLPQGPFFQTFVVEFCGGTPSKLKVTVLEALAVSGSSDGSSCVVRLWESNADTAEKTVAPPALDGTLTKAQLDCLSCEGRAEVSHGRVALYKTMTAVSGTVELFSLPNDIAVGATFGETVNGEFRTTSNGPSQGNKGGQLILDLDSGMGVVDLWGHEEGNLDGVSLIGWFDDGARQGTPISNGHTIFWTTAAGSSSPHRYRFSLRTYYGHLPSYPVRFHWYHWANSNCCIRHEVELLNISVRPLPCEPTGRAPLTPEYRATISGADGHVEMRLPCCAQCHGNYVCSEGDTTSWFVAWPSEPTITNGMVVDGHGKGWRLLNNTLFAPGPEGVGYEFNP